MTDPFQAFYDGVIGATPDEVIGALAVGLALALACSGLCVLARRRSTDAFPVICGLVFAVSAVSMTIGLGYAQVKSTRPGAFERSRRPSAQAGPTGSHPTPHHHEAQREGRRAGLALLREADADKDGRLTPEEAAGFVRRADSAGKGWVDAHELEHARKPPSPPPAVAEPPPDPARPAGPRVD